MKTSRRDFIKSSLLTTAGISFAHNSAAAASWEKWSMDYPGSIQQPSFNEGFKISIFSKHLQWLDYAEMAKVAAAMGFDGVDLTVRPQGHVAPDHVEEELPRAVAAVRNQGMEVYMITTSINNAADPLTERILKTASSLGIRHYRTGYYMYDDKVSVEENLGKIKSQLAKLAVLNNKYAISGDYQNHSGASYFGAPIWDLHGVLKQINSPWIGSQYDINHATVEGAYTWPIGLELLKSHIKSIDIKDFLWTKKDGEWQVEYVPLGAGMVDFKKYFGLLKQYAVSVPISIHYEYGLGGAEHGARNLTVRPDEVITAMKKDLMMLKTFL
jgi:sugar phosphate isomerase/epimerase